MYILYNYNNYNYTLMLPWTILYNYNVLTVLLAIKLIIVNLPIKSNCGAARTYMYLTY